MTHYRWSGAKLRELRESKEWTQEQLAKKVRDYGHAGLQKTSRGTVAGWEDGGNPGADFIAALAQVFEVQKEILQAFFEIVEYQEVRAA